MSSDKFVDELRSAIEAEYVDVNYELGWRLLSCPIANLKKKICFLGLNPAGKSPDAENDGFSAEQGSSYITEIWGEYPAGQAPLQKQICALFEFLNVAPKNVLSGNLIPFRSPRLADLPDKHRALKFGQEIWLQILRKSEVKTIIAMGNDVTKSLSNALNITPLDKYPSGWGNISIYKGERDNMKLIGLRHLSTFKIFSRPECQEYLQRVFCPA